VSQQGLCSRKFVQDVSGQWTDIEYWWNKSFKFKKWHDQQYQTTWLIASKWSSTQWWRSAHTPANIKKLRISHTQSRR